MPIILFISFKRAKLITFSSNCIGFSHLAIRLALWTLCVHVRRTHDFAIENYFLVIGEYIDFGEMASSLKMPDRNQPTAMALLTSLRYPSIDAGVMRNT